MAFYTQRGFVSLSSSSRLGNRYSIVSARWTATRGAFATCVLSPFVRCRRLYVVYRCSRDALTFHPVSPCALRSRSGHACLCRTCRGRFALIELMVAERRRGRRSRRAESEKMARRRSCFSVRPSRPTTTTSQASARPSRGWSGPAGWPAPSRPRGGESGDDKDSAKTGHRRCISHSLPPFF